MHPLKRTYNDVRRVLLLYRQAPSGATFASCPFCGISVFFEPARGAGIRCAQCSAGAVQVFMGRALRELVPSLGTLSVCELSHVGSIASWLRAHAKSIAQSEYFEDIEPGTLHDGVRCEDVQQLTYPSDAFDLVTHTEVLEHVADDRRAFAELLRILRPGGRMIFTVPLHDGEHTLERARLRDGTIEHLHEAVYHTDPLRPDGILAFRDYGRDILERVSDAGFTHVRFHRTRRKAPFSHHRSVITATKP